MQVIQDLVNKALEDLPNQALLALVKKKLEAHQKAFQSAIDTGLKRYFAFNNLAVVYELDRRRPAILLP